MARIVHGTLTPGVVTTHTLDPATAQVTILNRSQTGEIYFRVDGTDPTVAGTDSFVCLGSRAVNTISVVAAPVVKLISSTAANYTVSGETS